MLFPKYDFVFPYNTKSDVLTNAQAGLFHATETYSDQELSKNDEKENKALSMNCEYVSYIYIYIYIHTYIHTYICIYVYS